MLSRGWVMVLRAVWVALFAAILWVSYWMREYFTTDPDAWVGAVGRASVWMGTIVIFFLGWPQLKCPEIVPDCFYKVKKSVTTLQVTQSMLFDHIAILLVLLFIFIIPFDPSIGPNRSFLTFLIAGVLGGAFGIWWVALVVRSWPMEVAFVVDDEGVTFWHSHNRYTSIAYEDITKITMSKRQVFRLKSFILRGRVTARTFGNNPFGRIRAQVVADGFFSVPRWVHRGFRNEEVLERILAHCGDQVEVEYVKKLSQKPY